ncbi:hypothetical protein MMC34_005297 [Xylographa carneopallida]|nr:hypothetical protein [Xylographa carneopallida]
MGRKHDFEELLARAKTQGYQRGAHTAEDEVRDRHKHVQKVQKDQNAALDRYVLWYLDGVQDDYARRGLPAPTEAMAREHCLGKGVDAPDLVAVKDFIRFHTATSCGRIP